MELKQKVAEREQESAEREKFLTEWQVVTALIEGMIIPISKFTYLYAY